MLLFQLVISTRPRDSNGAIRALRAHCALRAHPVRASRASCARFARTMRTLSSILMRNHPVPEQ